MSSDYSGKPKHLPHSCSELFATPKFIPRIKKQNKTEKAKKKNGRDDVGHHSNLHWDFLGIFGSEGFSRQLAPKGPVTTGAGREVAEVATIDRCWVGTPKMSLLER